MTVLAKRPKGLAMRSDVPTLRSLDDAGPHVDLEKVFDISKLYALTIDTSVEESIARQGVWHPSSAGMCKRSQVLAFTRVKPTDRQSRQLKEIFKLGHVVHDIVQTALEKLPVAMQRYGVNVDVQREVPCNRETDRLFLDYGIAGTADNLVRLHNAAFEQRGVVEIKSIADERFKEVKKQESPLTKHLMQANLYAYRFDCPLVWMFYFNKNNSKRLGFTLLFDLVYFDLAVGYFQQCADFVRRGQLPPREEDYLECGDCLYRTLCDPVLLRSRTGMLQAPRNLIRRRKP
jgi:CRISPR/Cas system-associated exonuclease Cas4 (RecB family)